MRRELGRKCRQARGAAAAAVMERGSSHTWKAATLISILEGKKKKLFVLLSVDETTFMGRPVETKQHKSFQLVHS